MPTIRAVRRIGLAESLGYCSIEDTAHLQLDETTDALRLHPLERACNVRCCEIAHRQIVQLGTFAHRPVPSVQGIAGSPTNADHGEGVVRYLLERHVLLALKTF